MGLDITAQQVKVIAETHGIFAASLRQSLTEATGVELAAEVTETVAGTYADFTRTFPEGYSYYVNETVTYDFAGYTFLFALSPLDGLVEVDFPLPFSFGLWDCVAGAGASPAGQGVPYQITNEVYFAMTDAIGQIYKSAIQGFAAGWTLGPVVALEQLQWEPVVGSTMVLPQYDTPAADEAAVRSTVRVSSEAVAGEVSICYPAKVLASMEPYWG